MTSQERARAFLQAHLDQTVSMEMLGELGESFEDHREDAIADKILERSSGVRDGRPLRAVPDLDEEVDDDSAE